MPLVGHGERGEQGSGFSKASMFSDAWDFASPLVSMCRSLHVFPADHIVFLRPPKLRECVPHTLPVLSLSLSLSLPFLPRPPFFFASRPFSVIALSSLHITSHRFIPDPIVAPCHSCPPRNPLICHLCCSANATVPPSLHVEAIFIHSFIAQTTPFFYFGG